ncbi:hypothetical protein SRABI98_03478 [Microbacterium sp. Bi98]|nr:hypothetical protein SRABI98_03478 [Microbacterium sp. Bi98]
MDAGQRKTPAAFATGVSADVRPKGLEPLTFWLVVHELLDLDAEWAAWRAAEGVGA